MYNEKKIISILTIIVFVANIVFASILGYSFYIRYTSTQKLNKITEKLNIQLKINSLINQLREYKNQSDTLKFIIDKLKSEIKLMPIIERDKRRALEKKLQFINVFIYNKTIGATGSGVTIKYKDKFYILSAGHMAENETDTLILGENGAEICELEIIKHDYNFDDSLDKATDLILLKPKNSEIIPTKYIEIAENEPTTSEDIYIVGNPMGIEDVLSDGRVIKFEGNFMYFIGTSYFGNSGGGVYNKDGKLVGIVSHMIPLVANPLIPPYIINGVVRLSQIYKFLEGVE